MMAKIQVDVCHVDLEMMEIHFPESRAPNY